MFNPVAVEEQKRDSRSHGVIHLMSAEKQIKTCVGSSGVNDVEVKEWSPLQMTNGDDFTFGNYALVILNTPITIEPQQMVTFWNRATFRVTVDGGTNRWYDFCKNVSTDVKLVRKDPELVTGDFDSIDNSLLQSCRNNSNVKVICTPDQDKTDFMKALEEVAKYKSDEKLDSILVIVENCGRLDHQLSNIDTLHSPDLVPSIRVYVMSNNSLTWLLKPGHHIIHIPMRIWSSDVWCGLLPMQGPTRVTTTGLKWNLKNQYLEFGKLISSSNTYGEVSYQREGVTVRTDRNLLWTMGFKPETLVNNVL